MDATQRGNTNRVSDPFLERCQKAFQDFLEEFQVDGVKKYLGPALELYHIDRNTLAVSFRDIEEANNTLSESIQKEFSRLYPALCQAVRLFVADARGHADGGTEQLPPVQFLANKEFHLSLCDVPDTQRLRQLTTARLGTLVRIRGQVVRSHPVHPELVEAAFRCLMCDTVITGVEQQFRYTPPTVCRNPECNNRNKFDLVASRSKFVDFQKVRIQEVQSELPRGSIPRSLDVILRHELVESLQPGDEAQLTGTLIVVPNSAALSSATSAGARLESGSRLARQPDQDGSGVGGLKSLGVRELTYRLAFLACHAEASNTGLIIQAGPQGLESEDTPHPAADAGMTRESLKDHFSPEDWTSINRMVSDPELYSNLSSSLFPSIHGNEEVKRGILLMLLGGVAKTTSEGTHLRGDINVCIVGDPSTAKSQLLKQTAEFAPRAVYTSGKASSAAGLTAAVVRDEETFEFVIEAGALMLADNGVCCIDEFDKMDNRDQVAIHEAMEQQTISITKAGVKANLNARTSILAAANPVAGRYDRSKSLKQNIAMSAPIMSRFDLFFVLVDECNDVMDYAIAKRIVELHSGSETSSVSMARKYTVKELRRYISFCRCFKPRISPSAMTAMVAEYKRMRQKDASGAARSAWRITVRQLESLVRLAEAAARLAASDTVEVCHVREAHRLLSKSIVRVEQPDIHLEEEMVIPEEALREERPPEQAAPMDIDEDRVDGEVAMDENIDEPARLTLTFEQYRAISTMLVVHLRRVEEAAVAVEIEGDDVATAAAGAVRRTALVEWYLEQIEDELETEAAMIQKKKLVERVIHRLVNQDNVLIQLRSSASAIEATEEQRKLDEEDPLLVVHPNYTVE